MPTQANTEKIVQFREDARFLLNLFTNTRMDKKLDFGGNLSGYVNGHKNPSLEKIKKFYRVFGKDLKLHKRTIPDVDNEAEVDADQPGSNYAAELKNIQESLSLIKDLLVTLQPDKAFADIRERLVKIEERLPVAPPCRSPNEGVKENHG